MLFLKNVLSIMEIQKLIMPGGTKKSFIMVVIFELGINDLCNKYLLSTYHVLEIILDIGDTEIYKTDKISCPHGTPTWVDEQAYLME